MMSTSNTYVLTLTTTIRYLSLTINFISLIIGTFGSIFNLVIFTAPQLRRNACVFYLLCANIFQLVSILFIVPTRMALDSFGSRLENESLIFCKIRYYLVLTLPELATYYLGRSMETHPLFGKIFFLIFFWLNMPKRSRKHFW